MRNKNIIHPQEVELFFLMPAIRRELALFMKARGMKNKDIAEKLFVTEAAISQYINEKRAMDIELEPYFKSEIEQASLRIKDRISMVREMQRLINIAREDKMICRLHAKYSNIPQGCSLCFEK